MGILCKRWGWSCDCNIKKPVVEIKRLYKGKTWEWMSQDSKLIFVVEGDIDYSYSHYRNLKISSGMFCFIPVGQRVVCNSLSAATLVIVRLFYLSDSQLYRQLSSLLITEVICDDEPQALETKTPIKRFIEDLFICMNDGLICQKYLNGKVNELFFLFKAYYSAYDKKRFSKGLSHVISFSLRMFINVICNIRPLNRWRKP